MMTFVIQTYLNGMLLFRMWNFYIYDVLLNIYLTALVCIAPQDRIGCVESRCYFFVSTRSSWEDASEFCGRNGSYLATVPDEDTHDLLSKYVKREEVLVWIGGQEVVLPGWRWLTNEKYEGDCGKLLLFSVWCIIRDIFRVLLECVR